MSLTSMTGFARNDGVHEGAVWAWELKTVNGRGLDLRFRLPAGFDSVEAEARRLAGSVLVRGNCNVSLALSRTATRQEVRIDEAALASLLSAIEKAPGAARLEPPSWDGLLGLRGVVELVEPEEGGSEAEALRAALIEGFAAALDALVAIRREEGARLAAIVAERLDRIEALARAADASPSRMPERIREKLANALSDLLAEASQLDSDRLHQEALLLAAKSDIREEIDRLLAHVDAARDLLAAGGSVGRRLDFLAQELNRETNTLCAKAADIEITRTGLDLKAVVEQFREQVQNIE